jgi:O-antigen/teichoic acid export membrane protein
MVELYGISLFTNALDLSWFFLGEKQMWPAVVADIMTQLLLASCAYGCIHQPEQAFLMPIFFVAGRVLAVTFLIATFIRLNGLPIFGIDWPFLRNLLSKALPLCGSQVMCMISNNFDLLLIGVVLGTTGAGLYGAAARIVWVPTTIAVAYYTALRPLVARAYTQGFETVEQTFQRSVRVTTALSLGIATGGIVLAQPLMIQMFGAKYASATGSLQVLLAAFALVLVSRNYRLVLACFNQQPVDFRIMTAAAIVNIALNLLLIKPFGITGAACATLASESLILVCDYASTRWLIKHVPLGRYIWRPVLCCAIMTSALMLAQPISSVWPKIALGGGLYAVLLILFRIVTPEEISAFMASFKHKDEKPVDEKPIDEKPVDENLRHNQPLSSVAAKEQ